VEGSGAPVYYMKGALEGVLVKCDSYLQHGSVRPLANTAVPATVVRHAAELGKGGEAAATLPSIPTCKLTVSRDSEGVKCGILSFLRLQLKLFTCCTVLYMCR
jgi:hypothetical protein